MNNEKEHSLGREFYHEKLWKKKRNDQQLDTLLLQIWLLMFFLYSIVYIIKRKKNKLMGKLIENYSLQMQLGAGVYSRVFKAINVVTKQEVAIKMVKADKFKEIPKLEEGTINEINTLTSLKPCPNIIRYYDMLKTVNNFYFVYEYCNGGTLQKILKRSNALGEKQALVYFRQLLSAFKVLAQNNIMHRDIKPENILIHNGILKVADFGFCKPLEHQDGMAETMLGSPIYMAPEVLKGEAYTMKADVWSLGVVLYRMIFGFCPFQSNNIGKLILMLNENQLRIPSSPQISAAADELLRKMLTKDFKMRADWNEVFTFEVTESGQISNTHKMSKTNESLGGSLKASTAGSLNSNRSPTYTEQQEESIRRVRRVQSPQHYESKNFNKMVFGHPRETLKQKSPIRGSVSNRYSKKQVYIKNHKKCIELSQLAIEVASYQFFQAITISYVLNKSLEKELHSLKESLKKDYLPIVMNSTHKTDDSFIHDLNNMLNEEFKQLTEVQRTYQNILAECNICGCDIIRDKRKHLKNFIVSMKQLESKEELSLCHQLLDFILEDILINKATYQKLNTEQMCKKIRDKLHQMN